MKKKKKSIDYGKWGLLFILPFFITYLIFSLIPLIDTVRYSFFEYYRSGIKVVGPNFVGMKNYISLLSSDMFLYGKNTLILWLIGFVPQIDGCTCTCLLVYRSSNEDPRQTVL